MTLYTVTSNFREINFHPENVLEEILQNVYTVISTLQYSVPLNRPFGMSASYLDTPHLVAQSKFASEVIEKVEQYEPRAIVEEVTFTQNEVNGQFYPVVTIRPAEGVI